MSLNEKLLEAQKYAELYGCAYIRMGSDMTIEVLNPEDVVLLVHKDFEHDEERAADRKEQDELLDEWYRTEECPYDKR